LIRLWLSRILVGTVLVINVQCALAFILRPAAYAPGFELSGGAGEGMVRGMGVLFLMWNVPYAVAALNPRKHRLSLFEAITMQTIGLVGESAILLSLPSGHVIVRQTIMRFIIFDGAGLAALLLAAWIVWDRVR
jgi:hypothetical protein